MIISGQIAREETRHNQTEVFEKATASAATDLWIPLLLTENPGNSNFHVNISRRYNLDHDTNSERIWLTGVWVVRGSTIFLPPMLPYLSAQLEGCEDTKILKRHH